MPSDLLLCVATDLESGILRERLPAGHSVRLVRTGVGPVNAAHALTVALLAKRPDAILVCGVGGAYPDAGLAVGDVVCAEAEVYGDLGAQSPGGFLDMKALGFPVVSSGTTRLFNELPMQIFPAERRGVFVTVSTCTGTSAVARELQARTRGVVENMEGAAIAHVANLHGIPVGELRGISNMVTDRDPSSWRLKDAAAVAQEAALAWIARQ